MSDYIAISADASNASALDSDEPIATAAADATRETFRAEKLKHDKAVIASDKRTEVSGSAIKSITCFDPLFMAVNRSIRHLLRHRNLPMGYPSSSRSFDHLLRSFDHRMGYPWITIDIDEAFLQREMRPLLPIPVDYTESESDDSDLSSCTPSTCTGNRTDASRTSRITRSITPSSISSETSQIDNHLTDFPKFPISQPGAIPKFIQAVVDNVDAPMQFAPSIMIFKQLFGDGDKFPTTQMVIEEAPMMHAEETMKAPNPKAKEITAPIIAKMGNAMANIDSTDLKVELEDYIEAIDNPLVTAMGDIKMAGPAMNLLIANSESAQSAMIRRWGAIKIIPMGAKTCERPISDMIGINNQSIMLELARCGFGPRDIITMDKQLPAEIGPDVLCETNTMEAIVSAMTPDQAIEYQCDRRAMWSKLRAMNRVGPHQRDMSALAPISAMIASVSITAMMSSSPIRVDMDASEKIIKIPRSVYQRFELIAATSIGRAVFDRLSDKEWNAESQILFEPYIEIHELQITMGDDEPMRFTWASQAIEIVCDKQKRDTKITMRPTAIKAIWQRIAGRCGRAIRSREETAMPNNRNPLGASVGFKSWMKNPLGDGRDVSIKLIAKRAVPIDVTVAMRDLANYDMAMH